ncbi:MAG: ribonuclease P protein component 4 [Candidatus Woesearchaeota archaeon]
MPKKKKRSKKELLEEIRVLLQKAEAVFKSEGQVVAKRLVRKARRLAMSERLKLPIELKRRFCRHCNAIFVPSKSVRIRTREKKLIYYCLSCKRYTRIGLGTKS